MDIGVIGLGVMGENLILNMIDKKFSVGVYNRTYSKTEAFVSKVNNQEHAKGYKHLNEMVQGLSQPRKILMMVKAGDPVDAFLRELIPLLTDKDVVIDGGNSNYHDTTRRCKELEGKFHFLGCGISGGEEGARNGPAIMPGGSKDGWALVSGILQSISARGMNGSPCCYFVGPEGSGHLVKTVHNGIEYAEMQIIADFYQILRDTHTPAEINQVFNEWKKAGTSGYLLESMQIILNKKRDNAYLIDQIVDASEQKGTGAWTAIESLSTGVPTPIISEAVIARTLSGQKDLRMRLSQVLNLGKVISEDIANKSWSEIDNQNISDPQATKEPLPLSVEEMRQAFLLCRVLSYTQGFNLIQRISQANNWNISLKDLCSLWSNGCIIRSEFLPILSSICDTSTLETSSEFICFSKEGILPLRKIAIYSISNGINIPCILSSLNYYDALRTDSSSGNVIQALRDLFGAHTLVLKNTSEHIHIDWLN
ncbi:6-phosphogluconate dehydrogenase [Nematocida sp. AWRm80]|nr:6-phosphogluconate dehydrogenase [Nematocida sp. AWRm80]